MKKSDIAIQVEKEHECIKRDMGDIEGAISKEIPFEEFSEWRLEFMWRLRDFRLHLLKHFDLEEEGGFMNEILAEAPESAGKVAKLEQEHQQIVSDLDGVLSSLKELELRNDEKLQDVRRRVSQLISAIRNHEAAENDLIQVAYCQEYGYPAA